MAAAARTWRAAVHSRRARPRRLVMLTLDPSASTRLHSTSNHVHIFSDKLDTVLPISLVNDLNVFTGETKGLAAYRAPITRHILKISRCELTLFRVFETTVLCLPWYLYMRPRADYKAVVPCQNKIILKNYRPEPPPSIDRPKIILFQHGTTSKIILKNFTPFQCFILTWNYVWNEIK